MIVYIFIVSFFIPHYYSKPVTNCNQQKPCLNILRESLDSGNKYRICLSWDSSNYGCNKDDTIGYSCSTKLESNKINKWKQGEGEKMCKIVSCGSKAQFGIKDGKGCQSTQRSDANTGLIFGDIKNVECEYTGGYCGGGAQKDCTWTVPSPECPTISTTDTPAATTDIQCVPEFSTNTLVPYDEKKCKMKEFRCAAQHSSLWSDPKCGCGCIPTEPGTTETPAVTTDLQCVPELSTNTLIPYDEKKCKMKGLSCKMKELSLWTDTKCGCGCIPQTTTITPKCVPENVIFVSAELENEICVPDLHRCAHGYKYWSEPNCGCGCEWIGEGEGCLITDIMHPHGSFLGVTRNTCVDEAYYIGHKKECIDGKEVIEPYQASCTAERLDSKSVCCQIGPVGESGAAVCIVKDKCVPYGFQCANDTKVCPNGFIAHRSISNNCEFKCPTVLKIPCGRGIEGYRFVAYADKCEEIQEKGGLNCDNGMVEYTDVCGCGCRPKCLVTIGSYFLDFKENCNEYLMCRDGYSRVDDMCGCYCAPESTKNSHYYASVDHQLLDYNTNDTGSLNRLQFLTLNVFISIIICGVIIGVCLSMYYLYAKCGKRRKNYDFVGSNDDLEPI